MWKASGMTYCKDPKAIVVWQEMMASLLSYILLWVWRTKNNVKDFLEWRFIKHGDSKGYRYKVKFATKRAKFGLISTDVKQHWLLAT